MFFRSFKSYLELISCETFLSIFPLQFFFNFQTIPHKTIETNKKNPSPASMLSLGHIWASTLTWGGGIDLKRV